MFRINRVKRIVMVALAFLGTVSISHAETVQLDVVPQKSRLTVPGEVIIEVKRGVLDLGKEKGIIPQELAIMKSESLEALNKKYGLISIERLFSGTRKDAPSDIYVLRFSPQIDINELVSAYRQDSSIIYAEPNYIMRTSSTLDAAALDR